METQKNNEGKEGPSNNQDSPNTSRRYEHQYSQQASRIKTQQVKMEKLSNLLKKVDPILSENSKNLTKKYQWDASQKWNEIEGLDEVIKIEDTDVDDIAYYDRQYANLQLLYDEVSCKLQRKLDHLDNSGEIRATTSHKLQLRPIEIPKFNGDHMRWRTFIETFSDAVERANLSNIERFHYLLNNLEPEAKQAINHLQIVGDNYQQAVEILRSRYENNRKTATAYIEILLDLPQLQSRSAESLLKMYNTIKECTVNLSNMQFNIQSWNPILATVVLRKLDYETSRIFEEGLARPKEIPTLDCLMEFLDRRFKTLEAIKANRRSAQQCCSATRVIRVVSRLISLMCE
jgi:Protein of unknown function (DUF1759)